MPIVGRVAGIEMVVEQVERDCAVLASEGVQQVDLTDTGAHVMVEGRVAAVGIELLGLYCQETAETASPSYPDQEIGAPARFLVPGGVEDAEGVGVLEVQHFEGEEIRQRLLTQARAEKMGTGEASPSVGRYPGCRCHRGDRGGVVRRGPAVRRSRGILRCDSQAGAAWEPWPA